MAAMYDFERAKGLEVDDLPNGLWHWSLPSETNILGDLDKHDNIFNKRDDFLEMQLLYLMESKWFRPTVVGTRTETVNGAVVNVLSVAFGRDTVEYYIDDKTSLPFRIKYRAWISETKTYYEDGYFLEDYVDIAGVKFPTVVRRSKKADARTLYQVNVPINRDLFTKEPTIVAGPDAWKPRD
jgi:hypothetical protein